MPRAKLFLGKAAFFGWRQRPHFLQRPDFTLLADAFRTAAAGKIELNRMRVFQLNSFKYRLAVFNQNGLYVPVKMLRSTTFSWRYKIKLLSYIAGTDFQNCGETEGISFRGSSAGQFFIMDSTGT